MSRSASLLACLPPSLLFSDCRLTPTLTVELGFGLGFVRGIGIYATSAPLIAARLPDREVYALDSLGCGLSTREKWEQPYGQGADPTEVENFFVHGFEGFRRALRIDRFSYVGHSVGGYLGVAYAERHGERLRDLVLVSPVGVPEPPAEVVAYAEQEEAKETGAGSGGKDQAGSAHGEAIPAPRRRLPSAFVYLRDTARAMWAQGWGPFNVPFKYSLLGYYTRMRFKEASWTPHALLQNYWYTNWVRTHPSAGAYAHSTLLYPGAYARKPLWSRIPKLRLPSTGSGSSLKAGPKVSFVYGTRDWMDFRVAVAVQRQIESGATAAAAGEKPPACSVYTVEDSGHNLMVDNRKCLL